MNKGSVERLQLRGNDRQAYVKRAERREHIKAERKKRRTESIEQDLVTRSAQLDQRASRIVRLNETFINLYESLYEYGTDKGMYYAEPNKRFGVYRAQFKSPWIVLQKGNPGKCDWVVGRVVQQGEYADRSNHSFSSFATNEQSVSRIKQNPLVDNGELMMATGCITEHTGVMYDAETMVTDRRISPVSAVYRYLEHRKISGQLDRVQETTELFEQAVTDPVLNPHLVHVKLDQPRRVNRSY